jgi:RecJ-like exonuclease
MDDDDDSRLACEHCNGTGSFAGHRCDKCGGKGVFFKVPGKPTRHRLDRPSRRPAK